MIIITRPLRAPQILPDEHTAEFKVAEIPAQVFSMSLMMLLRQSTMALLLAATPFLAAPAEFV